MSGTGGSNMGAEMLVKVVMMKVMVEVTRQV